MTFRIRPSAFASAPQPPAPPWDASRCLSLALLSSHCKPQRAGQSRSTIPSRRKKDLRRGYKITDILEDGMYKTYSVQMPELNPDDTTSVMTEVGEIAPVILREAMDSGFDAFRRSRAL